MHPVIMSKWAETTISNNKQIEYGKRRHNLKAICGGKLVLDS